MRLHFWIPLFLATALHAADTFHSGTVAVTANEDTPANITYNNIRDAVVVSPPGSSAYKYRIKSLGASTKLLKTTAGSADVIPGTTVVVAATPGTNETVSLQYTADDDEFTLFLSAVPSTPPVVVAVIEVLDTTGASLLATVNLTIDIQGVADTREGASGYYQAPSVGAPTPIVIPRGGSVKMNYVEFVAHFGFVDKERDGCAFFEPNSTGGSDYGGVTGVTIALVNNPASPTPGGPWPDRVFIKGTSPANTFLYWAYGDSSDYSTDSLTISIPSNQPLGTFILCGAGVLYDTDGLGPTIPSAYTAKYPLTITVTAAGGSGSGSGGGSGGGGCGVGALSSLLMLMLSGFALYRRRPEA